MEKKDTIDYLKTKKKEKKEEEEMFLKEKYKINYMKQKTDAKWEKKNIIKQ